MANCVLYFSQCIIFIECYTICSVCGIYNIHTQYIINANLLLTVSWFLLNENNFNNCLNTAVFFLTHACIQICYKARVDGVWFWYIYVTSCETEWSRMFFLKILFSESWYVFLFCGLCCIIYTKSASKNKYCMVMLCILFVIITVISLWLFMFMRLLAS